MQKKLIALAVAGLMSAPAFAQSNVTIYGVVDFGYVWTGDSAIPGVDSRQGIDGGNSAGNRIGFKGTEDLGNGLKASFVYETGVQGDYNHSDGLFNGNNRQAYVALSGNFGTVALGRQYAPQHSLLAGNIDPFGFGKGTVAAINNVYTGPARLDNLAAYVSPNWGGFSFVAGYTNNAIGNETVQNGFGTGPDARAWALYPTYKNGPVFVGLNVHQIHLNADSDFSIKTWDLGGTYDFGVVKLGAVYGVTDDEAGLFTGAGGLAAKVKQWALTAAVPVGSAGKIQASFVRRKNDFDAAISDAKVTQWGIGYEHALSKRTAVYTAYSDINNKGSADWDDGGFGAGYIGTAQGGNVAGGNYQRGLTVGLRHSF